MSAIKKWDLGNLKKFYNMDDVKETIGEIITTTDYEVIENKSTVVNEDDDYEYARHNYYDLIERGNDALEELIEIAKASQNPRAFEVVATLIKTIGEQNRDLVDMKLKKTKIDKEDGKTPGNVQNNVFVGSTAELMKLIKGKK